MQGRGSGARRGSMLIVALALALVGCGRDDAVTVVRGADDVQVLTPRQVGEQRLPTVTTVGGTTTTGSSGSTSSVEPGSTPEDTVETVPQNQDDRPPELRLFEAFGKFRTCLEDKGYGIDGDLLDPNNPAYKDPAYLEAVQTCAARTDIVSVLQEVQATRSSLTPEEVEARNEVFIALRDCLIARGWKVEAQTSEIGLLEPTVFQNADGVLDERDINQCLSEQNLGG